ncbi:cuticular protein RR-1 motif 26 precursor [Bombyx mori]|uniref:Putative cuticle protein n=1 Tax=Bombyx mori TaxID=7091 RepID=C0H6L7_BOMMO|nr:cuticular protein RR-1 motif 26 precursor [Bombyx mori]FAA00528.1 TPA: putative cuticle protein [Bombyx mori]
MMKLLVLFSFLALAHSAPQGPKDDNVQLLKFDSDNDGLGSYRFLYEQTDGSKRDEQGEVINVGTDDESIVIKGSYSWVAPDGITYTVTYVADDKGFQPSIEQGPGGAIPSSVIASLVG